MASVSDQNTNIIGPSEPQGEIVDPNISSTSDDGEPVLETIPDSSSNGQSDLSSTSLVAGSHIDPVNEQSIRLSNDNYYVRNYRHKWVSNSARQEG